MNPVFSDSSISKTAWIDFTGNTRSNLPSMIDVRSAAHAKSNRLKDLILSNEDVFKTAKNVGNES